MPKLTYDAAEITRLEGVIETEEAARQAAAQEIRDLVDNDEGWDASKDDRHAQLVAREQMHSREIDRVQAHIVSMKAARPKTEAEVKAIAEDPFNRWARKGAAELTPDERVQQQNFQETFGNDANTNNPKYVIPFDMADVPAGTDMRRHERFNAPTAPTDTGLASTIIEPQDLNYFQPMTAYGQALGMFSSIYTAHGNPIHFWIAPDDTALANGPLTNLLTAQTESPLPDTWDELTLAVQLYNTNYFDISRYTFEDAQFNVRAWAMAVAYRRVGRKLEQQAASGTGATGNPRGFFTASTDTNAAATTGGKFTWDASIDIEHSIDYAYLFGAEEGLYGYTHRIGETGYVTSWKFMSVLKKLKDNDGRPLYLPNIHTRSVFDLNGYPIKICHEFATADQVEGNNKKPIVFGNFGHLVQRWAGAGLMIEQFYDSATALNNTIRYLGRWRWGCGIVGQYDGTKDTATMKSKALKRMVLKSS